MSAAIGNKLSVNKTTIRKLTIEEADSVAGGTTIPCVALVSSEPCGAMITTVIISIAECDFS